MPSKTDFVALLLSNKPDYEEQGAELIYNQLCKADSDVREAALEWIKSDQDTALIAEGYSTNRLKDEFEMNTLAALLTVDWLRKNPKDAIQALKDGIK